MRWRIAILVSAAIAISYLDRQALPVAIQAITRDIPLTNGQFSALQSAFLFSYALMYAGGGKLVDILGTHRGFTVIMLFWSLACASHALATSFILLATSRFLLGLGEGGGFPAATRGRGMVPGKRTRNRDGHHQCRDGSWSCRRPSPYCCRSRLHQLALDLRSHRWIRVALGCMVEVVVRSSRRKFGSDRLGYECDAGIGRGTIPLVPPVSDPRNLGDS